MELLATGYANPVPRWINTSPQVSSMKCSRFSCWPPCTLSAPVSWTFRASWPGLAPAVCPQARIKLETKLALTPSLTQKPCPNAPEHVRTRLAHSRGSPLLLCKAVHELWDRGEWGDNVTLSSMRRRLGCAGLTQPAPSPSPHGPGRHPVQSCPIAPSASVLGLRL